MEQINKEDIYRTIVAPSEGQFRDRGSKFLGFAFPVRTTQQVREQLLKLKKAHPKASHHCYAFRLGTEGISFRANDDGEPSGSAGKPILGQIDSYELVNVLVVVVRYFGGSLLGIPGLINAYRTTAAETLSAAEMIEKQIEQQIDIFFDYPVMGDVQHILKRYEATVYKQDFSLFCHIQAGIPMRSAGECMIKLLELRGVKLEQGGT